MTTQPRKILVTCALPYANGAIHLGHMLEHIQADIWVRFQRMRGNKIHFVCADDAHGTPIMLNADKLGITPEELIAKAKADHVRDFAGFYHLQPEDVLVIQDDMDLPVGSLLSLIHI